MENLKENVKEIEKIKKENYKIKENINTLNHVSTELYHKNYDEFKKNDETIKKYKNKIELNKIKIAILKNNLHYLLKMDFEGIKAKMLDYYENKKIGEKTKEKMQDEIKQYFKDNYNVNISCYITIDVNEYFNNYELTFNFGFLNNDGFKSYILEYNEDFKITFDKRKYNNYELQILYYNNIVEYIEIKDISQKAKELQKEYTKTVEKIEKLRIQQKELYHNFTDYIHGFIYNDLTIDTKLSIY